MIRAGALMYALVVILLSSVVTGMVISGYSLQRELLERFNIARQLEHDLHSATTLYCRGGLGVIIPGDTITFDLFRDGRSEVTLTVSKWGSLEVLTAMASQGREARVGRFLLGVGKEDIEPVGLYLSDKGRFLSVSGDTRLSGDCYLPAGTARISSIEGQHFPYDDIAKGKIFKSASSLSKPDSGVFYFQNRYAAGFLSEEDSLVFIAGLTSDRLERSFGESTLVVKGGESFILDGMSASGKIVFISDSLIVVAGSTLLSDVILISRDIIIQDGFEGNFQAFATRSVIIGKNCMLKLPSVIVTSQNDNAWYSHEDSLKVEIGTGSIVCGNVILSTAGLPCYFLSGKYSRVIGQVYCPGSVELGGSIEGSLYSDGFYLKTTRSWYLNHLLNNRVEFDGLPTTYAGVDIFGTIERKTLIKWLP